MSNIYDFDTALKDYYNRASQDIGNAEKSPDDADRAFRLSKASGTPASLIAEDPEEFEKNVKGDLAGQILRQNAPLTAFTNSHPLHPPLIQDDVANLDDVSKSIDKLAWSPYQTMYKANADMVKATQEGDEDGFAAAAARLARGVRSPTRAQATSEVPTGGPNLDLYKYIVGGAYIATAGFPIGLYQGAKDLVEKARTGELHQEFSEGDLSPGTIASAFSIAQLIQPGLRMGVDLPKGRMDIFPPGPRPGQEGLPTPEPPPGPPTLDLTPEPSGQLSFSLAPEWQAEVDRIKPWADAGVEPLPTISTLADFAHEHQAMLDQEGLKGSVDASAKTALLERSPEKFEEFLEHHQDTSVTIPAQTLVEHPDAFPWLEQPTSPAPTVVPSSQFLAKFDKTNWNEVKDDISLGGLTLNQVKELEPQLPVEGDNLDQIRHALGLTAWHASPAEFTSFDLEKQGTSQGAASFGPGFYFAESPAVSGRGGAYDQEIQARTGEPAQIYQVQLKAELDKMIDHDKPLAQQTPYVQDILKKLGVSKSESVAQALEELRDKGASPAALANEEASEKRWRQLPKKLSRAGIHGIRYLDEQSRNRNTVDLRRSRSYWEKNPDHPESSQRIEEINKIIAEEEAAPKTSNYVMFDPSRIKITSRNGEPVPQALQRQVLERSRSGRPLRTTPFKPSADKSILEAGYEHALPEAPALNPFQKGTDMGVSQDLYNRLVKKIEEQTNDDASWRARRLDAQAKLEASNAWKEERASLEPAVRAEMENLGLVGAWNRLRKVKLDPMELTPAAKADIPELIGQGGLHPDDAAKQFGFPTGKDLVDALRDLSTMAEGKGDIVDRLVNDRLDRMVQAKLGKTPLERLDAEIDQGLSLTTLEMLHEKVALLGEQLGQKLPMSRTAMNWAAKTDLEKKPFYGLSAYKLMQQVVSSANKVRLALGKGKTLEAFKEMQNQYLLSVQARIMREVEKEAKANDRLAKRFAKREVPNFPVEHASFAQQILLQTGQRVERLPADLRRVIEMGAKNEGWASTLDDFVTRLTEKEAYNSPVAEWLRNGETKSFKSMTISEARAAFDSLRTIVKRGAEEQRFTKEGEAIDARDLLDDLIGKIEKIGSFKMRPMTERGRFGKVFSQAKAFHYAEISAENFFDRIGEFERGNLGLKWLVDPLVEGFYKRDRMIKDFAKDYKALGKIAYPNRTVKNDLFRDPDRWELDKITFYPDMTRLDAYAVLANAGNRSNAKKLLEGYGVLTPKGEPDYQRLYNWLQRELTQADADWMQRYGEITSKIKDLADANALRESDVPAENIPLEGLTLHGKQYAGWYHRLTPHEFWEGRVQAATSLDLEGPGYTRAATPRSYEKARTNAVYPLSLDFDRAVRASVGEMLHDIALRGPVRNMAKALRDKKLRAAIRNHVSKEALNSLENWLLSLSNSASTDWASQAAGQGAARWFRKNIVGNALNFNPGTPIKHGVTSWARSMIEAGPVTFLTAVPQVWNPIRLVADLNINHVMQSSKELPTRADFWEHTVTGAVSKVSGKMGVMELWNKIGRSPVAFSDMISTAPTFYGTYMKVLRETGDEEMAVTEGDRAVVRAHGSLNLARRPAMLGANPYWEMFTPFMSFLNTIYQAYYRAFAHGKIAGQAAAEGEAGKAFAHFNKFIFPFLATAGAVALSEEVKRQLLGGGPKEEKGALHTLQQAGAVLQPLAAGIPIISQIVQGMESGGDVVFGIAASGVNEVFQAVRESAKAIDAITKNRRIPDKDKSRLIEKIIGATGAFPGRPIGVAAANWHRMATSQLRPRTGWEFFRYLVGGKVNK